MQIFSRMHMRSRQFRLPRNRQRWLKVARKWQTNCCYLAGNVFLEILYGQLMTEKQGKLNWIKKDGKLELISDIQFTDGRRWKYREISQKTKISQKCFSTGNVFYRSQYMDYLNDSCSLTFWRLSVKNVVIFFDRGSYIIIITLPWQFVNSYPNMLVISYIDRTSTRTPYFGYFVLWQVVNSYTGICYTFRTWSSLRLHVWRSRFSIE